MNEQTFRIYALNTETGHSNEYTVWMNENELEDQIEALNENGYDSITCVQLEI